MCAICYLETGSLNPYFNLAFEEYVLRNKTQGDYLMLWQNDNTIVVGQNQITEAEINRSVVDARGIRVVRRATGGGAVYHDLGNLNYSFFTDVDDAGRITMERFTKPVVAALRGLGVHAVASGRNDILIDGRKVSGTAQRLYRNRILHHGTLLFDSDPSCIADALRVDPEKYRSRATQSVRSRIANIRPFLRTDMSLTDFWTYLKQALADGGLYQLELSREELLQVEQLKREKYDTWEWNYGHCPSFNVTNRCRFPGGVLEPRLTVEHGYIVEAEFYGDFLSLCSTDAVCRALEGCLFCAEAVEAALKDLNLSLYFGTITLDELICCLFNTA